MISSMTAFARIDVQENWGQVCWELRSVNHRYLDISIRLPENFRRLEVAIREHIQQHLKRGKIDCNLYFQRNESQNTQWEINKKVVQELWKAIQQVNSITSNSTPPNPIEILRWQDVLTTKVLDIDEIGESVLLHFNTALTELITQRQREGAQLATFIEQRCTAITTEIEQVRQELPTILQEQRQRLEKRLAELVELNSERLEQEIVIIAQKMDVAEELDRMETHLTEIKQVLNNNQAVGRRLDFLVQELHREANTLGAKSNHINTSHHSVELKVLIDQMREQTQNIE
jgi:uncharacterized protein (TIGR00255 family)